MATDFYFYHHQKSYTLDNGKIPNSVWLPLMPEAEQMIRHFKAKQPEANIHVESSLLKEFKNKEGFKEINTKKHEHNKTSRKIFLYAQSDTLANSISIIGKKLTIHQLLYIVPQKSSEKADEYFKHHNIPFRTYNYNLLKKEKPDLLLLLNDWSKEAQRIIAHCHLLNIPVICLQESVIDFGDQFKRMQWADEVFVQGIQSIIDLKRKSYFLTGNPRYENIRSKTRIEGEHVLINCNFTYGIFEDKREGWLDDIHEILKENQMPYAISQHPRDKGDLGKYDKIIPSSSSKVEEQLKQSIFLITRFSSLIHEALVMGVPVIYYNPHGEIMQYDFEFDEKLLQLAKNKDELNTAVNRLRNANIDHMYLNDYLARHCLSKSSLPSDNINYLMSNFLFEPLRASAKDYSNMVLYHPAIKTKLSNIKKLFSKRT